MLNLIIVNNPKNWPLHVPGVSLVSARAYLTEPHYLVQRGVRVFNLCRSYRYQSAGYYVSLLAMARGHKPMPSIMTIQDMKTSAIAPVVADEMGDLIQEQLRQIQSDTFTLSIYFGRNLARRYDDLASKLFRLFPAPLLRAEFAREKEEWRLQTIGPIAVNDVPESHREFVGEAAKAFFGRKRQLRPRRSTAPYDLAILVNEHEKLPPSNKGALRKFAAAARRSGLDVEFIEREDYSRLAEFDGLFIRETTQVNHHTYRFARRALANGLVVIDDPDSILRCTNKVYLAELLARNKIPIPRTVIVHRDNRDRVQLTLGLPCILKLPDSSFSQGVIKVENKLALLEAIDAMLERSDLIIAQEYLPTSYDWRIGVLDREPLFACKYFMVREHWQIYKSEAGKLRDGQTESIPLDQVPPVVLNTARRAARLIGEGFYGVDLKQFGRKAMVIEINDNPNVDAGVEDGLLKESLYDQVMRVFRRRMDEKKHRTSNGAS